MTYNEYHQVLEAGVKAEDLVVFKYEDQGVATLEDGLYALEGKLADPAFVETDSQLRFVHPPEHGALGRERCARPCHQVRMRAEHAVQIFDGGISNLGGARRQPAESLNDQRRCGWRSMGPRRPAGDAAHDRGAGPRATQLEGVPGLGCRRRNGARSALARFSV